MKATRTLFALALGALTLAAQQPAGPPPQSRMAALQALKLPKLVGGSLPTYYSPEAIGRARKLQLFIEGERAFYRAHLAVPLDDLVLAVLNPKQWDPVSAPEPYGMPSVDGRPRVIVMPADWDKVVAMQLPRESDARPDLRQQAQATGMAWRDLMHRGADGIGAHELGHAIVKDYGIDAQTYWFNEFLASYVGDVYVVEKRPRDVAANRIFWQASLQGPHPHTTLAYFESHYDELQEKDPGNYGWYQCALDQRVIAVHAQEGIGFLVKVKAAFPRGGPKLKTEQVLDRLEAMDPGWKAWAAGLEAGAVSYYVKPLRPPSGNPRTWQYAAVSRASFRARGKSAGGVVFITHGEFSTP